MDVEEMSASHAANASIQALRQAKRALRKEIGRKLDSLDPVSIVSQSERVSSFICRHSAYQKADKISIYVSMDKGEIRTEELCREALMSGKRLYVPRFASAAAAKSSDAKFGQDLKFENDMRMLRLHDWKDFEAMVMNKWGIREPADMISSVSREDALEEASGGDGLDLILAPGVAFDRSGGRLGHGKGYYDRYIERCTLFEQKKKRPGPIVIGLALEEQLLQEPQKVPADEQDRVMDDIITSQGSLLQR